jgi:tRNA(Ile)-lysidine synthase TilS/MesJ
MIEENDVIAVGVSGGKDSTALLCALAQMRRFYPKKYDVKAISIDLGFESMDFSPLTELCKSLCVEHTVVKTDIAKIVFDSKKESSPCSLCSRMRRGALHNEAERLGCTKVALGHNKDDVSVTLLLNILYAGKIEVFWPKNTPDGHGMTLIRPLIYTSEKTIKEFCSKNKLPIIKNTCPVDKHTEREGIKRIINELDREHRGVSHRIFRAIEKSEIDGFINPV